MKLSKRINNFQKGGLHPDYFYIEYDGWQFEAKSEKAVFNLVLKYIFEELDK